MWSLRTLAQGLGTCQGSRRLWKVGAGGATQQSPWGSARRVPARTYCGLCPGLGSRVLGDCSAVVFTAETLDKPQLEEWKMVLNLDAVKDVL